MATQGSGNATCEEPRNGIITMTTPAASSFNKSHRSFFFGGLTRRMTIRLIAIGFSVDVKKKKYSVANPWIFEYLYL
jgi:hypothetical protein